MDLRTPEEPGRDVKPSIFYTDECKDLAESSGSKSVKFDQCKFGLDYKKPTQILSNGDLHDLDGKKCDHGVGAHRTLRDKDGLGGWNTTAQAWYPSDLCSALAQAYLKSYMARAYPDGVVGLKGSARAPIPLQQRQ